MPASSTDRAIQRTTTGHKLRDGGREVECDEVADTRAIIGGGELQRWVVGVEEMPQVCLCVGSVTGQ